jgi:hypothetical protein
MTYHPGRLRRRFEKILRALRYDTDMRVKSFLFVLPIATTAMKGLSYPTS